MNKKDFWNIEPEWLGETVVIFAGGPSLTQEQVSSCRGFRTIAINDSWRLAPWADILYWCDRKWWDGIGGHGLFGAGSAAAVLEKFEGRIVTLENLAVVNPRILHIANYSHCADVGPICLEPRDGVVTGGNSGYQAINLSVLLGVKRIILLGYDMKWKGKRSHWFGNHPAGDDRNVYERSFIPKMRLAAPRLKELGVEVFNATPDTALDAFECVDLDSLLPDSRSAALSA